ncbi:MAG: hypothetical protein CMK49_04050 [Prochlorococcus sp. SP3034]|nr:hypothetical protein [Prochlorococcus sp. SP3034]
MKALHKSFRKYHYLISILFFPFIYVLGWLAISILIYPLPFLYEDKSLYGTIITLIIFLLCLPFWSKYKWRKNISQVIGLVNLKDKKLFSILISEFFKAFIVILLISFFAVLGGYAAFIFRINNFIILNSIFLGLIVGFAEELVFRVWLFEELNLFLKKRFANFLQAIIFAIVHLRWDFNLIDNIQLLIGLFLLGLYLNKWRESKYPTIFVPICFHASIVGIWFLINSSFLSIQTNIPKTLFGPGSGSEINPIGGLLGIFIILGLVLFNSSRFKSIFQKIRV